MPAQKPRPGVAGATLVLSVRVPVELAEAAMTAAGGSKRLSEWLQQTIRRAVQGETRGPGAAQLAGYEEGKRQGWAHANKVFREALGAAAEKLKGN